MTCRSCGTAVGSTRGKRDGVARRGRCQARRGSRRRACRHLSIRTTGRHWSWASRWRRWIATASSSTGRGKRCRTSWCRAADRGRRLRGTPRASQPRPPCQRPAGAERPPARRRDYRRRGPTLPVQIDGTALGMSTWMTDAGPFDVLAGLEAADGRLVPYEEPAERAATFQGDGFVIRTASIEDIIAAKRASRAAQGPRGAARATRNTKPRAPRGCPGGPQRRRTREMTSTCGSRIGERRFR